MILDELKQLEQESKKRKIPIIGSEKGKWLIDKLNEIKPKRILELGTANGYSAIILASTDADVTTVEIDEKIAEEAKKNFEKYGAKVHIMVGDGIKFAKSLADHPANKETFDIIFIDFAKKKYIKVLDDCITLIRKDGLIISDNINMEKCKDYKTKIMNDKRLKTEIINIKDGMACSKKISHT